MNSRAQNPGKVARVVLMLILNPSKPPYCGIPDQLLYIACVCAGSIIIILFCYCYQVTFQASLSYIYWVRYIKS